MLDFVIPPVVALLASNYLTPAVRRFACRVGAIDAPGGRKIHRAAIPRLGGVAIILAFVLAIGVAYALQPSGYADAFLDSNVGQALLFGGSIIFLLGVWDDIRPLRASHKFAVQSVAALTAMQCGILVERISFLGGESLELGVFAWPITLLWLVGITNAFNLIDGLDGLATGLAIIAALTSSTIFFLKGDVSNGLLLLILVGAAAGFLRHNFNPATIFLGDCGSLSLGFILAVTAVSGSQKKALALATVIPLLVFGLPIIDTLLSMLRRFVGSMAVFRSYRAPIGKRLKLLKMMFEADQSHIHHRLLARGLSHRNAVLMLYVLSLSFSGLAFISVLAQYRNSGMILLTAMIAAYVGIHKLGYKEIEFLRAGTLLRWYDQLSFDRRFFLVVVDSILISAAFWSAVALRRDLAWRAESLRWFVEVFPLILIVRVAIFFGLSLYRRVWRALGIADMIYVGLAVVLAVFASYSVAMIIEPPQMLTLPLMIIDAVLLGVFVLGSRSAYRILDYFRRLQQADGDGVLIYGAGRRGLLVLNQLQQGDFHLKPLGFLDDDRRLRSRTIDSLPIFGGGRDLPAVLERRNIHAIIVSSKKIRGQEFEDVLKICQERNVQVFRYSYAIERVEHVVERPSPAPRIVAAGS